MKKTMFAVLMISLSGLINTTAQAAGMTSGSISVSLTIIAPVNCVSNDKNAICYDLSGKKQTNYAVQKDEKNNTVAIIF